MPEGKKSNARELAESGFFWWRIAVTVVAILTAAWVQFAGPGVKAWMQEAMGIEEIKQRLAFLEDIMPSPRVVDWSESAATQIGVCTVRRCDYQLAGARTEFGETCGPPMEVSAMIRAEDGSIIHAGFETGWEPPELARHQVSFIVPLDIPPNLPPADYWWQSRVVYPHCVGPREPIPRYSPWWPLTITAAE